MVGAQFGTPHRVHDVAVAQEVSLRGLLRGQIFGPLWEEHQLHCQRAGRARCSGRRQAELLPS